MAEAYQCERCNKLELGKAPVTVAVRPRTEVGATNFYKEICEVCAHAVREFISDPGLDTNRFTLKALKNSGIDTECGACMSVAFTGTNVNEHTCEPKPVPVVLREGDR